jgi:Protein of unknown function (DUF2637)
MTQIIPPSSTASPPADSDAKAQQISARGAADRERMVIEAKLKAEQTRIEREQDRADKEAKQRRRNEAREARDHRRAKAKTVRKAAWQARWEKAKAAGRWAKDNGPRIVPGAVYGAGVAVAITGQASVAHADAPKGLGWDWVPAYGTGGFIEGLAISMALTEHTLRKRGRAGRIPQALCWLFAMFAAAVQVYAHQDSPWEAAILAASSIATITVLQIRMNMAIAKHLESIGLKARPRPRLGAAYWLRFPVAAFYAWSASVADPSIRTRDQAIGAGEHRRYARANRKQALRVLDAQQLPLKLAVKAATNATRRVGKRGILPWTRKKAALRAGQDFEAAMRAITELAVLTAATAAATPVRAIASTPAAVQSRPEDAEDAAIERAKQWAPEPQPVPATKVAKVQQPTAKTEPEPKRTPKPTPRQKPQPASSGSEKKDKMREFIREYYAEHGKEPSYRKCDAAAGTNGYASQVRNEMIAELGLELTVRDAKAS